MRGSCIRDSYFDSIICLSVIEHGFNEDLFFSQFSRILKKGGFLILSFDYWEKKINTDLPIETIHKITTEKITPILNKDVNLSKYLHKEYIKDYLEELEQFLIELSEHYDSTKDSDLLNIRDEMLGEVNKLKYLLTLD